MIVIISHPRDEHATRVSELLRRRGHASLLLDLSNLPAQGALAIDYARPEDPRVSYLDASGESADLSGARSIWWRRPQAPSVEGVGDADTRAFAFNEWQEALNGMWAILDCPWMNPPHHDEIAARKLYQLKIAAS